VGAEVPPAQLQPDACDCIVPAPAGHVWQVGKPPCGEERYVPAAHEQTGAAAPPAQAQPALQTWQACEFAL
jgi:hypothetical protein